MKINISEKSNNKNSFKVTKTSQKCLNELLKVPNIFKIMYDKIKIKCRYYRPLNELKNIKFILSRIESDDTDNFFPYKFYIEMKQNEKNIKFEIFLSKITTKYTIRSIPYNDVKDDNYSNIKGFNNCDNLLYNMIDQFNKLY